MDFEALSCKNRETSVVLTVITMNDAKTSELMRWTSITRWALAHRLMDAHTGLLFD
jgi:hypothetical protein